MNSRLHLNSCVLALHTIILAEQNYPGKAREKAWLTEALNRLHQDIGEKKMVGGDVVVVDLRNGIYSQNSIVLQGLRLLLLVQSYAYKLGVIRVSLSTR